MTIAVGQPLPRSLAEASVVDRANTPHVLETTWRERDVVLVFVRHFACIGCAEHITALRPRLDELALLGVEVVIVGSGTPAQLDAFIEREDLARPHVQYFTDHTLAAYRAAGLVRSRWGTFGPIALGQAARAYLHGHRNGKAQGDLHQQGGTLYITRGGTVVMYHRATSLGDHAKLVDVVEIALAARAEDRVVTWPFHVANALYLISYAVKEILWLRLVTVLANITALIAMGRADPMPPRVAFAWQAVFFAINVARLVQLIHERRPVPLPPDAKRLAKSVFPHLRPRELLRLLAVGEILEHPAGELVIRQGESLAHLAIVIDGTARVKLVDGTRVIELSHGAFIGELSYLTGRPPAADVVAASSLRLVRWPAAALRDHLASNPEIRAAMQAVLGSDLAAKLRGRA